MPFIKSIKLRVSYFLMISSFTVLVVSNGLNKTKNSLIWFHHSWLWLSAIDWIKLRVLKYDFIIHGLVDNNGQNKLRILKYDFIIHGFGCQQLIYELRVSYIGLYHSWFWSEFSPNPHHLDLAASQDCFSLNSLMQDCEFHNCVSFTSIQPLSQTTWDSPGYKEVD